MYSCLKQQYYVFQTLEPKEICQQMSRIVAQLELLLTLAHIYRSYSLLFSFHQKLHLHKTLITLESGVSL